MLNKVEKKYSVKTTPKDTLQKWYELMTLGRLLDERAPNYLKQAIGWSYHAPYAGHDAIQLAIGQAFTNGEDHLFPYYRDMLTAISAGLTAEEIILKKHLPPIQKESGELSFVSGMTATLLLIGYLFIHFQIHADIAWIYILVVALLIFLACFVGLCLATMMYILFKKMLKK